MRKKAAENTKFIRVSNMFEGGTKIQLSKKRNVHAFLRFEEEKAVLGRNLATGLAFLVVPKNHQVQGLTYTASGED